MVAMQCANHPSPNSQMKSSSPHATRVPDEAPVPHSPRDLQTSQLDSEPFASAPTQPAMCSSDRFIGCLGLQ